MLGYSSYLFWRMVERVYENFVGHHYLLSHQGEFKGRKALRPYASLSITLVHSLNHLGATLPCSSLSMEEGRWRWDQLTYRFFMHPG